MFSEPQPFVSSDSGSTPRAGVIRRSGTHPGPSMVGLQLNLDAPANFPASVRVVKRVIDIVGATCGLILASPLMLFSAIAVKVSSPGPVFFKQVRVRHAAVRGNTIFKMVKFRTMRQDAESKTGPVWATRDDPRITKVGKFLRKTRLDEIPQLWNVLKGEMSLVGPRPERPHFTDKLQQEIPAYEDRAVALKPGVTGWAQVSCEYDASVDDVRRKLLYDIAYAAHLYRLSSYLKIELKILLLTVMVVFTGRGAH